MDEPASLLDMDPPGAATPQGDATTAAAATTGDPTPQDFSLGSLIGDDLNFKEGWADALSKKLGDGDTRGLAIKGDATLAQIKNLPDALNMLVHSQKAFRESGKVVVPKEGSSQEVVDSFYQSIGKPKAAEEYKFANTAGQEVQAQEGYIKFAFENNLSQAQANAGLQFYEQQKMSEAEEKQAQSKAEMTETFNKLTSEWGGNYKANVKKIANFFENLGEGSELLEGFIDSGLVNNYGFMKGMFDQVVSHFSEDNDLISNAEPVQSGDIQAEIDKLKADERYQKGHPEFVNRMDQLYKSRRELQTRKAS